LIAIQNCKEAAYGHQVDAPAREEHAGHEDGQGEKRGEIALVRTSGIDEAGDHEEIANHLDRCVPVGAGNPAQEDDVDNRKGIPQNNQGDKIATGRRQRRELAHGQHDPQQEGDD
jgi:hypothetical protein